MRDEDRRGADDRVVIHDFEVPCPPVGQVQDRLRGDERCGDEVFVGFFRKRDEIFGHVPIVFVEGDMLFGMVAEEDEIFGDVPSGRDSEHEQERHRERYPGPAVRPGHFSEQEQDRYGREEERERLGADGSERVRKSFVGQEFRYQHGKESEDKKGMYGQFGVRMTRAEAFAENPD